LRLLFMEMDLSTKKNSNYVTKKASSKIVNLFSKSI